MALITDVINYSWFCNLPDNLIAQNMVNLLLADTQLNQAFYGNISAYRRDDNQDRMTPALNVYPTQFYGTNQMSMHIGNLVLEAILPQEIIRPLEVEVYSTLLNVFVLRSKTSSWLTYMRENGVPGIIELGKIYNATPGNFLNDKSKDSWVIKYNMSYKIDMLGYFEYLAQNGLSPLDPCNQVGAILTGSVPVPTPEPQPE